MTSMMNIRRGQSHRPEGRKLPVRFYKPTVFAIQIFRSKASQKSTFWNAGRNHKTTGPKNSSSLN
jgi:hypothetical protein